MYSVDFKPAKLTDKEWVKQITEGLSFFNSEYGFGNMFIWSDAFKTEIARYKDFVLLRSVLEDEPVYSFPVGRGDLKGAVDFLIEYAKDNSHNLVFFNATESVIPFLDDNYPEKFIYKPRREVSDYIYRTRDLIELSGKKYHQKRNHVNAFKKKYDWSFEILSRDNIYECSEMYDKWLSDKDAASDENYVEYDAVMKTFQNYEDLGFVGGVLRVDGKVVAFTVGEALNDKVFCTHIEKADTAFDGSYAMINNAFSINCLKEYEFVNREEDMGIEGLRKSKLSYHPEFLLHKNLAVYRG